MRWAWCVAALPRAALSGVKESPCEHRDDNGNPNFGSLRERFRPTRVTEILFCFSSFPFLFLHYFLFVFSDIKTI
jgi:hypothetical protein